jgi:hypothetical protein
MGQSRGLRGAYPRPLRALRAHALDRAQSRCAMGSDNSIGRFAAPHRIFALSVATSLKISGAAQRFQIAWVKGCPPVQRLNISFHQLRTLSAARRFLFSGIGRMACQLHAKAQETNGAAPEAQGSVPPLPIPTSGSHFCPVKTVPTLVARGEICSLRPAFSGCAC